MRKHRIIGEMATLAGGNVLAQLVTVLSYLVLVRLFSPDDYGLFNIFYSAIEVLLILSTCKYELAIIVARDGDEAAAVARFALRLNTIVSIFLLVLVFLLWHFAALPQHFARLGSLVLLIPPMVFFCGTSRVYSFLYNRFHCYAAIAVSDNVNAISGALFKMLFGLLRFAPAGLPLGAVLGQAAANVNYRLGLRKLALPSTSRPQRSAVARRFRNYPRYVAPKDLVNTISANLPFLWAAAFFDRAEIGLFGVALTFTLQPVNLISTAIERVLYARTADSVRQRQPIAPLLRRFFAVAVPLAAVVCVAAWFWADPLFGFFFGNRWTGSAPYVRALLPWVFAAFISTSLMFISNVFGTQRVEFYFYLGMLILRAAAVYAGIRMGSFLLAMRMFAIASAAVHAALVVWYAAQVRRYSRSLTT